MNTMLNSIALRYRQSIITTQGKGTEVNDNLILGLMAELSVFGYTLDSEIIADLKTYRMSDFLEFKDLLIGEIRAMTGTNKKWIPLFKGFPEDVPDESFLFDRIFNHLMNCAGLDPVAGKALSCGHVVDTNTFDMDKFNGCPICGRMVDEIKPELGSYAALEDVIIGKVIKKASKETILQIFTNLASAKTSISEEDAAVLRDLIGHFEDGIFDYVPEDMPFKENATLVAGMLLKTCDSSERLIATLANNINTATDVLRFATELSGGDVSLKENTRFKLSNKQKNVILGILDSIVSPEEDMLRNRNRWLRLGEVTHPGSKKSRFPNANIAFDVLRNRPETIDTFASITEELVSRVKGGDIVANLVLHLKKRPGELARRMDFILANGDACNPRVLWEFEQVAAKVSSPVLLSMLGQFLEDDTRNTIDKEVLSQLEAIIKSTLIERYSELSRDLGNVYINPELKNYLIPATQRSASKALVTIARGSQVSLEPSTHTARLFLWWHDAVSSESSFSSRVDVDLSAVAYDENWKKKGHVSYTNLKDGGNFHSGDITSAPNGACEFIDINIDDSLKRGIRYIAMNVLSYSGQQFDNFECFAGFMERQKPNSGEPFDARTVKNRFDISGGTRINCPLVFDLVTKRIIWCDFSLKGHDAFNNVERNAGSLVGMSQVAESMIRDKVNLFELLEMHFESRADCVDFVKDPEKEYDTVFDVDFATKVDEISSDWI